MGFLQDLNKFHGQVNPVAKALAQKSSDLGLKGTQSFKFDQSKKLGKPRAIARTATRSRQRVSESIQRRTPRSGIEVTRPAENQFLEGPNVTGVNELEDL